MNPLSEQLKDQYAGKTLVTGQPMTGMLANHGPGMTVAHVKLLLEIVQRLDALDDLAKPTVFIEGKRAKLGGDVAGA